MPTFVLAIGLLCLLGILLSLGRRLEPALRLERLGIPIALLVGSAALLLGPYGPWKLLPSSVTEIWVGLPAPLLTLVFATLLLGRPIPKSQGLWKPVASQAFLSLVLGFGQYVVGGIVVLGLLTPLLGVDPLMGCLIEIGFEGGHGAAAIMGKTFSSLGYEEGVDLGLAMATVGLLSSTVLGSGLVVFARWKGWVVSKTSSEIGVTGADEIQLSFVELLNQLLVNLALVGIAVFFGESILLILRLFADYFGGLYRDVIMVFPVFPLALLGSLLTRLLLERFDKTSLVSRLLQREIGTLATDLLITTAMASINLQLLRSDWIPLTILAITGLTWNLLAICLFSKLIFKEEWFERSITEFGNATGVAASGLLLLRLSDPRNITNTLPIFSIKQLFLQPLLSGGIVTVLAPIIITQLGLIGWTEICGFLTLLFIGLAFLI